MILATLAASVTASILYPISNRVYINDIQPRDGDH